MSGDFLEASRPLLAWVGRTTVEASLIALLVLVAQWLLRGRVSARWRYNLWLLVVARLLLPSVPGSKASPFNYVHVPVGAVKQRLINLPAAPPRRVAPAAPIPAAPSPRPETGLYLASNATREMVPSEADAPKVGVSEPPILSPLAAVGGALVEDEPPRRATQPRPVPVWNVAPPPVLSAPPAASSRGVAAAPVAPPVLPWYLRVNWYAVLAIGWVAGAAFVATRLAWVSLRLALAVRNLRPVTDPALLALRDECARQLRMTRVPRLLRAPDTFGPALVGLLRPRVLLPDCVIGGENRPGTFHRHEVRLILMHELAHMKRWDVAANWLLAALGVLHWFNPVLWLAFRRMRADRELACDEAVLAATGRDAGRFYGPTILKLLAALSRGGRPVPMPGVGMVGVLEGVTEGLAEGILTGFANPKSSIRRRIAMIARFDGHRRPRRGATALGVSLSLLVGGVALTGAVNGQQLREVNAQVAGQPDATVQEQSDNQAPGAPEAEIAEAAEQQQQAQREAQRVAAQAARDAAQQTREAAKQARDAAHEALEAAQEKLNQAQQAVSERQNAVQEANEQRDRALEEARQQLDEQRQAAQEAIEQAKQSVAEARQGVAQRQDEAKQALEEARQQLAEVKRSNSERAAEADREGADNPDADAKQQADDAARQAEEEATRVVAEREQALQEGVNEGEQAVRQAGAQLQEAAGQQKQALAEAQAAVEQAARERQSAVQEAVVAVRQAVSEQQIAAQELGAVHQQLAQAETALAQAGQQGLGGEAPELPPSAGDPAEPTPVEPPAAQPPAALPEPVPVPEPQPEPQPQPAVGPVAAAAAPGANPAVGAAPPAAPAAGFPPEGELPPTPAPAAGAPGAPGAPGGYPPAYPAFPARPGYGRGYPGAYPGPQAPARGMMPGRPGAAQPPGGRGGMMGMMPGAPGIGGARSPGAAAGRIEDAAARNADAQTLARLQRPAPVDFNNMPLEEALNVLADSAGVDVVPDWRGLEGAGVNRSATVLLRIRQAVPAEQVLTWLLRSVDNGDVIGFAIDHGVVVVAPREKLDQMLITRAYDLGSNLAGAGKSLEQLVMESVAPQSWRESGGSGSARVFNGKLFVTATEPNQRQVERLLGLMGAQRIGGVPAGGGSLQAK